MLNWQEYAAGTDPNDERSFLKLEITAVPQSALLTFNAVSNLTYSVQYRDLLGLGPWTKVSDVPSLSTNRLETVADTNWTSGRLYRLVTPSP
jgi:hypothetical protein